MTLLAAPLLAQEFPPAPKPGPEHAVLKAMEGTWDAKMKIPDAPEAIPAVMTYKSELGGLWLASEFKSDVPGFQFQGKGFDGYDQAKKKYVGVWIDSMITGLMTMEGKYDEKTKTLTMTGVGPGEGGKEEQKFKSVTKMTDADHQTFQLFMIGDDGQETLGFTIEYTRKK
jgi:hypothetical protein